MDGCGSGGGVRGVVLGIGYGHVEGWVGVVLFRASDMAEFLKRVINSNSKKYVRRWFGWGMCGVGLDVEVGVEVGLWMPLFSF